MNDELCPQSNGAEGQDLHYWDCSEVKHNPGDVKYTCATATLSWLVLRRRAADAGLSHRVAENHRFTEHDQGKSTSEKSTHVANILHMDTVHSNPVCPISFGHRRFIDDTALRCLAQEGPSTLRKLVLDHCSEITEQGLQVRFCSPSLAHAVTAECMQTLGCRCASKTHTTSVGTTGPRVLACCCCVCATFHIAPGECSSVLLV